MNKYYNNDGTITSTMLELRKKILLEDVERLAEFDRWLNMWENALIDYRQYRMGKFVFTENMLIGRCGW